MKTVSGFRKLALLMIGLSAASMGFAQSQGTTAAPQGGAWESAPEAVPSEVDAAEEGNAEAGPVEDAATEVGTPETPDRRSPGEIAAAAYARGDWKTAIAQYRALLSEGYADAALYYNLGTAYARDGDRGRAVWMLLKASRLDPRDKSIWNNLNRVAPDLGSQMAFFPLPPLEIVYRSLKLNEWAMVGGGATLLAALAFALYFFMKPLARWRNTTRRIALASVVFAVVGHGFAAAKYYDEVVVVRGVVTDPETAPHSAPSDASEVYTFTLPPGTLIRIQNAGVEGWIKAVYGGKNEVFIRTGQFERLR